MIKNLVLLLIILFSSCCEEHVDECPCFAEHQNPIYKGCGPGTIYDLNNGCSVNGMYTQLYNVLKYPQEAIDDSIQGIIAVTFDIYDDGSIGNFAAKNDTLGHGLANAAIAAVKTLAIRGFCPARENCSPVIFNYTLPIKFILH